MSIKTYVEYLTLNKFNKFFKARIKLQNVQFKIYLTTLKIYIVEAVLMFIHVVIHPVRAKILK